MKKYAYWRTPKGRLSPDTQYAPQELLRSIGIHATVGENGVSWTLNQNYENSMLGIRASSAIKTPDGKELNEHDAWEIFRASIVNEIKRKGGKSPLQSDEILRAADIKAGQYFRIEEKQYDLVVSISTLKIPFKSTTISDCLIRPAKGFVNQHALPDITLRNIAGHPAYKEHLSKTKYQHVSIRTTGRSVYDAFEKAKSAMDILRGLWNLSITRGSWSFSMGIYRPKPLARIHYGPVYAMFTAGKKAQFQNFWFEPDYIEDVKIKKIGDKDWGVVEKNRKWALYKIRSSPFRAEIENLLARYASALDQINPDKAFLQLWSILEVITNTLESGSYDKTIERSVWYFKDRSTARDILKSLRVYRNRHVHTAYTSEDALSYTYGLKAFVDACLEQLIRNTFGARNLKEYSEIVSMPVNIETLDRRLELYKSVSSQRKKWHDQ